jgi:UPF0755 protein
MQKKKKLDFGYFILFVLILSIPLMFVSCKDKENNRNTDKIPDRMIDLFVRDSTNKTLEKRETINLEIPENIRLIKDMIILLEDSIGYNRGELKSYLDTSDFLKNNNLTLETLPAFFIPNTYQIYKGLSVESFFSRMKKEYETFWNISRLALCDSLGITEIEVSILASIVEEEQDRRIEERPIIAGLYLNRLNNKIKLQSDPTVIFANNDFTITRVFKKHLKYESPYNTYIHKGLPPGPICIPSINSIDAVLNAEPNDYIFMCGKGDGSGLHNFAITLREHNNNKKIFKRNVGFN